MYGKIINPLTNQAIRIGSAAYEKLVKQNVFSSFHVYIDIKVKRPSKTSAVSTLFRKQEKIEKIALDNCCVAELGGTTVGWDKGHEDAWSTIRLVGPPEKIIKIKPLILGIKKVTEYQPEQEEI